MRMVILIDGIGPNVFGISLTKSNANTPISGYTQMVYGDGTQYVAYSAQGVGHSLPVREADVLAWFGLRAGGGGGSPGTTTIKPTTTPGPTTTVPPTTTTTTAAPAGGTVPKWGQW